MSSVVLFLSLLSLCLVVGAPVPARTPVCALQSSSSATLIKTGETATSYQLSFKWTQNIPVDYVDYHYRINNEQFVNIRAYDGSTPAHQATHALNLSPGDVLHAMVTYSVNGVGCDVAITQTTAPSTTPSMRTRAPSTPAVIPPSHTASMSSTTQAISPHPIALSCDHITQQLVHDPTLGYNIYATLIPGSDFIDAHYSINNTPYNYRMIEGTTTNVLTLPKPIQVPVGTPISYYFTFGSSAAQACDSGRFETGGTVTQAGPTPIPVPVQQPAPLVEPQPEVIPLTQAPITTPTATQEQATAPVEAQAPAAGPVVTPDTAAEPPCAAGNIIHQVASDNERNYVVTFNTAPGDAPFDAVSIYTLVGSDEKTTPMGTNVATGQTPPIHVPEGQSLIYYVTYSRGGNECKTAFFST